MLYLFYFAPVIRSSDSDISSVNREWMGRNNEMQKDEKRDFLG